MNQTDLQAYLKKVGISQSLNINTDTLLLLHNAQHRRLPFENFDIALGRGISVAEQDIINKLIYRERGGYCYELNALLLNVLKTIGFDARPLLGRVHLSGTPSGRTHQFTLVTMGKISGSLMWGSVLTRHAHHYPLYSTKIFILTFKHSDLSNMSWLAICCKFNPMMTLSNGLICIV